MEKHSASTTLDDIINELQLTYDSSMGLLEGDAIREIPNVNTLLNLNKLLGNLSRELDEVEECNDKVLQKLAPKEPENTEEDDKMLDSIQKSDPPASSKHPMSDDDDEILSKRRKLSKGIASKIEEDATSPSSPTSPTSPISSPPPVQSGSFTPHHDTRLKNPHSQFVPSQTLSAAAIAELGLYSEETHGMETQGKEHLKKKYGVASYPENDLVRLLPGEIPDIDFSKNKPPNNQVQFSTFQTYIESYFRPYLSEDLELLQERDILPPGFLKQDYDPDVTPYIIPKLGPVYAEVWTDEDVTLGAKLNSPAYQQPFDSYKPKGSIEDLTEEGLYSEEISCGPLSSRLMSAILSNHEVEREEGDEEDDFEDVPTKLDTDEFKAEESDFHSIEERLKRELKYIGIFMNLPCGEDEKLSVRAKKSIIDNEEWIKNKEDDEVCAEMRFLQKLLRESVGRNRVNRKKLVPIIEEQIAYQEYCTILEDLDKQVDQAYMKRLKGKSKKKKVDVQVNPQQHAVNSGLRVLLEKRKRWIENIGRLFDKPEVMKRASEVDILVKEGVGEEEEEGEEVDILMKT